MPRTWRILSIDGGGIRGLIPATILAYIEARTGKSTHQLFDLIAGTSTGAILSLGLTKPDLSGNVEHSAKALRDIYERDAPEIFKNPASWWGNLLMPKYKSSRINKIMQRNFGEYRLKDALVDVLIPCYDIEHRHPHIFRSRWARRQQQYDYAMADVAAAASATPTMFDPLRVCRPGAGGFISLVDGGVFANNPSMHAFVELQTMHPGKDDDFLVVSLGTGESMEKLQRKYLMDWGYVRWSIPMIELVSESLSESVHRQMESLLPARGHQRYYRFQADLPDDTYFPLDNIAKENVAGLIEAAEKLLNDAPTLSRLKSLCDRLERLSDEQSRSGSTNGGESEIDRDISAKQSLHKSQVKSFLPGDYMITLFCAPEDEIAVAKPLAEALRKRSLLANLRVLGQIPLVQAATIQTPTLPPQALEVQTTAKAAEHNPADQSGNVETAAAQSQYSDSPSASQNAVIQNPDMQHSANPNAAFQHGALMLQTTFINIIVLSPSLLTNPAATDQLAWLYLKTLSGENVILPVVHNFVKSDISYLVRHMQWHSMPNEYLEYLYDLAGGAGSGGVEALADKIERDVLLWLR